MHCPDPRHQFSYLLLSFIHITMAIYAVRTFVNRNPRGCGRDSYVWADALHCGGREFQEQRSQKHRGHHHPSTCGIWMNKLREKGTTGPVAGGSATTPGIGETPSVSRSSTPARKVPTAFSPHWGGVPQHPTPAGNKFSATVTASSRTIGTARIGTARMGGEAGGSLGTATGGLGVFGGGSAPGRGPPGACLPPRPGTAPGVGTAGPGSPAPAFPFQAQSPCITRGPIGPDAIEPGTPGGAKDPRLRRPSSADSARNRSAEVGGAPKPACVKRLSCNVVTRKYRRRGGLEDRPEATPPEQEGLQQRHTPTHPAGAVLQGGADGISPVWGSSPKSPRPHGGPRAPLSARRPNSARHRYPYAIPPQHAKAPPTLSARKRAAAQPPLSARGPAQSDARAGFDAEHELAGLLGSPSSPSSPSYKSWCPFGGSVPPGGEDWPEHKDYRRGHQYHQTKL